MAGTAAVCGGGKFLAEDRPAKGFGVGAGALEAAAGVLPSDVALATVALRLGLALAAVRVAPVAPAGFGATADAPPAFVPDPVLADEATAVVPEAGGGTTFPSDVEDAPAPSVVAAGIWDEAPAGIALSTGESTIVVETTFCVRDASTRDKAELRAHSMNTSPKPEVITRGTLRT